MKVLKNFKTLALFLLLFFSVTCFAFEINSSNKNNKVEAQTIQYDISAINDTYEINDSVILPSNIDVSFNGKSYTSYCGIIKFPNNKVVSISGLSIDLNVVGEYSLEYFFNDDNGNVIVACDKFKVTDSLYYFSVENGSDALYVNESSTICKNNDENLLFANEKGVIARIKEGSVFKYSKPIDLSAGVNGDTTEIITFDPRLKEVEYDFEKSSYSVKDLIADKLIMQLTDCYDSTNYIQIIYDVVGDSHYFRVKTSKSDKSYGILYVLPTTAAENLNNRELYIDGKRGIAYFDDYGTYFTQYGYAGIRNPENYAYYTGIKLTFDYDKQRIYYEINGNKTLICDLTNSVLFGESEMISLTTGEVYLSMWAEEFDSGKSARVDLISIGGNSDLENKAYFDEVSPKISFASNIKNDILYVAKGQDVTIPSVDVYDANFAGDLSINVYRNYKTEQQSLVASNVPSFKASLIDTYSVVYTAKDMYGNISELVLDVVSVQAESALKIETEELKSLNFAKTNILPDFTVTSLNDNENISIALSVKIDDKVYKVDANNREFFVDKFGEYTISYVATDGIFTSEYTYSVNSQLSQDIVFLEKPIIDKYYIKNAKYSFKTFYAYQKNDADGFDLVESELYVAYDGGSFNKVNYKSFVITGEKTVQFKFVKDGYESEVYTSSIIGINYDMANCDFSKYFIGDFTNVKSYMDSETNEIVDYQFITFELNQNNEKNSLKFINKIDYTSLKFSFVVPKEMSNFGALKIKIIDAEDSSNIYTIKARNQADKLFVSFNGGIEYKTKGTFYDEINFIIYNDVNKILNFNGEKYKVDMSFNSRYVYLEMELEDVAGQSGLSVAKINNVDFYNGKISDDVKPIINSKKTFGQYNINSVVDINVPTANDVLSAIDINSIVFKVKMPDNTFAISQDGVELNLQGDCKESYSLKLTQYGTYIVYFEVKDVCGNRAVEQYVFTVDDNVSPVLELKGGLDTVSEITVKAGKFKLDYEVSDDVTAKNNILVQINLIKHDTMVMQNNVGKEFDLEKGQYTVSIYCADEKGNMTVKSIIINVQ